MHDGKKGAFYRVRGLVFVCMFVTSMTCSHMAVDGNLYARISFIRQCEAECHHVQAYIWESVIFVLPLSYDDTHKHIMDDWCEILVVLCRIDRHLWLFQ